MSSSVRILGLPKHLHRLFRRSLDLAGAGSQSQFLYSVVRRTIREQQEIHGEDLLRVLTAEEEDLLSVIRSGAAEFPQIVRESLMAERRVRELVNDLVERGIIEERKKGGKTEGARGAAITLYFVSEIKSKPE